jgi:hypothetical protein
MIMHRISLLIFAMIATVTGFASTAGAYISLNGVSLNGIDLHGTSVADLDRNLTSIRLSPAPAAGAADDNPANEQPLDRLDISTDW